MAGAVCSTRAKGTVSVNSCWYDSSRECDIHATVHSSTCAYLGLKVEECKIGIDTEYYRHI
jgi:hypothetical protein